MFPSAAFPPLSALHRLFFSALALALEPYIITSNLAINKRNIYGTYDRYNRSSAKRKDNVVQRTHQSGSAHQRLCDEYRTGKYSGCTGARSTAGAASENIQPRESYLCNRRICRFRGHKSGYTDCDREKRGIEPRVPGAYPQCRCPGNRAAHF